MWPAWPPSTMGLELTIPVLVSSIPRDTPSEVEPVLKAFGTLPGTGDDASTASLCLSSFVPLEEASAPGVGGELASVVATSGRFTTAVFGDSVSIPSNNAEGPSVERKLMPAIAVGALLLSEDV